MGSRLKRISKFKKKINLLHKNKIALQEKLYYNRFYAMRFFSLKKILFDKNSFKDKKTKSFDHFIKKTKLISQNKKPTRAQFFKNQNQQNKPNQPNKPNQSNRKARRAQFFKNQNQRAQFFKNQNQRAQFFKNQNQLNKGKKKFGISQFFKNEKKRNKKSKKKNSNFFYKKKHFIDEDLLLEFENQINHNNQKRRKIFLDTNMLSLTKDLKNTFRNYGGYLFKQYVFDGI